MSSPSEIVVAGGGMAALELVLALRELAGDGVQVTVIAPESDFVLRPLLVAEPLGAAAPVRRSWRAIADELGLRLVPGAVASVDPERRRVVLGSGATVGYDTLVLAPGARRVEAFDDAIHLPDEAGLRTLREEIARGEVAGVAFVAPTLTGWLLPLYEAALLTAAIDARVRVSLVTPETEPLAMFGAEGSRAVARALLEAGVEFVGGAPTATPAADRLVALPLVRGPRIPGVPTTGPYELIGVDEHCRVAGLADAYAIGDATDFPIKQGGLACRQAAAAAAHIAARHGAPVIPEPFRPVLGATLITGPGTSIDLGDGASGKLPGRYLASYLAAGSVATSA